LFDELSEYKAGDVKFQSTIDHDEVADTVALAYAHSPRAMYAGTHPDRHVNSADARSENVRPGVTTENVPFVVPHHSYVTKKIPARSTHI
jgi:hypothetical protein